MRADRSPGARPPRPAGRPPPMRSHSAAANERARRVPRGDRRRRHTGQGDGAPPCTPPRCRSSPWPPRRRARNRRGDGSPPGTRFPCSAACAGEPHLDKHLARRGGAGEIGHEELLRLQHPVTARGSQHHLAVERGHHGRAARPLDPRARDCRPPCHDCGSARDRRAATPRRGAGSARGRARRSPPRAGASWPRSRARPSSTRMPSRPGISLRSTRWAGRARRKSRSGTRLCPPASTLA